MDHPWRIIFCALLLDWVEEGNGRLVEVEREYWEAMSEGIMEAPASTSSGRERITTKRRAPLQPSRLQPAIVVEGGELGVAPRLKKLNIHRTRGYNYGV